MDWKVVQFIDQIQIGIIKRRLLAGIKEGGLPILETGKRGTRALVKHLRDGGIMSILLDEKVAEGTKIPFLGLDALT